MDSTVPNAPALTGPTPPSPNIEDPIQSVVATRQTKNRFLIVGFLVFMALVAVLICRKGKPSKSLVENDNAMASLTLPPAVTTTQPLPFEPILSKPTVHRREGEALWEVRSKSPMVIFNKASGAGNGEAHAISGINGPSDSSSGSLPDGNSTSSGVPLPRGFNPTAAASAHATVLRERDTLIAQGKVIDAVLETAVNSDHPGMLRALVSHDIYGDTGRTVLLPRGSRLIGQYDTAVAKGQNRVFVLWERVIRPDGVDIQLGSAGTDSLGRTGIDGQVNNHFWTMFGAATLLSVIGAAASTVDVNPADQNNSIAQYRESVTSGFNSAAGTVLGQYAQIKPTISVRQGVAIRVFVARDLYFDPALFGENGIAVIP